MDVSFDYGTVVMQVGMKLHEINEICAFLQAMLAIREG